MGSTSVEQERNMFSASKQKPQESFYPPMSASEPILPQQPTASLLDKMQQEDEFVMHTPSHSKLNALPSAEPAPWSASLWSSTSSSPFGVRISV